MSYMPYLTVWSDEIFIIFRYATLPMFFSLILILADWNFSVITSLITVIVFLRLVHNEDNRMSIGNLKFLFTKLIAAVIIYTVAILFATALEQSYLQRGPGNILESDSSPSSSIADETPSTWYFFSKMKVKPLPTYSKPSEAVSKIKYVVVRLIIEYFLATKKIAQYRFTFLAIIYTILGLVRFALWYFVPPPKQRPPSPRKSEEKKVVKENEPEPAVDDDDSNKKADNEENE